MFELYLSFAAFWCEVMITVLPLVNSTSYFVKKPYSKF